VTDTPGSSAVAAEAATELRTFLTADVRGYTRFTQEHGDAAAAQLVSRFAAITREGVRARGGRVIELRGDEALAVFGSARQALRAAVDLQLRFTGASVLDPSLPLPVGIGLDAGEAVPMEGGYRGEALNLAARLCNLAGPGEVLASEGVVYLGRRVQGLVYADRGMVQLKGFADPIRVLRVLSQEEAARVLIDDEEVGATLAEMAMPIGGFLGALPAGVLVGREQEWNQIMDALDAVTKGTGRLVLLSGEPGIGKTRLAQEVTLKARHWRFLVATGRCYEPEQAVPYYPFLEALVTLYQAAPSYIRAEIPRHWSYLGRLLPEQIDTPPMSSSEGQEDQQRLFRAVTGFLEALAETMPVALLLDDLHWADDSSLKLLQHLARYTRAHRVLLLGTYRNVEVHRHHPLETVLADLGREGLVEEVHIRRLDQDGALALMAEIMGGSEELAELVELVYQRTEGNAFFIQEMLHALVERGDVFRKDGHWELKRIREMEVPKSVRSVIGQRLSRLDERSQEILREASVLGQAFAFDDLLALGHFAPPPPSQRSRQLIGWDQSGWTEDEVEAALDGAIAAGLVRETAPDQYAFNHALTQQALYAELSTRRRKRLHLAAGKALERLPPDSPEWLPRDHPQGADRRAAELAWHFLEGDDAEQALPYAMLAGDQAEQVFANGEAVRHYRTALELAQELGDTARLTEALEKLAGVSAVNARYDRALELLEQAAAIHHAAGDREREACAVAQMGHVHFQRGTRDEGIARLQPLVQALDSGPPSNGLAALWAALARLYVNSSHHSEQLSAAERAVELATAIGDEELLISAQITRSDALWLQGQRDDAQRVLEDLIPQAERTGDLDNLGRALSNLAGYYADRGELDKEREYHQRQMEVAERRGDRGQIMLGTLLLSSNAFLVGDWPQARIYLDRAETIIGSLGANRLIAWPVLARGWLALREGNLEESAGYAAEALVLAERADPDWRRLATRLVAEKDLLEGKAAAAVNLLEGQMSDGGWQEDAGFLWTLAWAYLDADRYDDALEASSRAVEQARARRIQADMVEALAVRGLVLARQPRGEEAGHVLGEALDLARSMPFPFGEARALAYRGSWRAQRGEHDEALADLRQSLAIFERLGAREDARRVERAIEEVVPAAMSAISFASPAAPPPPTPPPAGGRGAT